MIVQDQGEIYPNTKLDRVHFEIRYYPLLEIDNNIVSFQKQLRSDLPNYRIEQLLKKDSMGIQEQTQHIISSDNNHLILKITNSNIVLSIAKYEGYGLFKELINSLVKKFLTQFDDIKDFLFIGMRYVNKFEFDIEKVNLKAITDYFNIDINPKKVIEKKIDDIKVEERYKIKNAIFKRLIVLKLNQKLKQYEVIIDLDSFTNEKISAEHLMGKLDELHANIKLEFEDIITDKLKDEILR